jgi:hypothetical protein
VAEPSGADTPDYLITFNSDVGAEQHGAAPQVVQFSTDNAQQDAGSFGLALLILLSPGAPGASAPATQANDVLTAGFPAFNGQQQLIGMAPISRISLNTYRIERPDTLIIRPESLGAPQFNENTDNQHTIVPGYMVYDKQGKLLGKVIDEQGTIQMNDPASYFGHS